MPGIFISYRRQDSGPWAGRIYDWLTGYWGRDHVFMDIDTIAPGEDFRVAIARTLTECDVALIVIGPKWLTVVNEAGSRRLDDRGDVHRTEVTSALARDDVRVIPVLVGEAFMPQLAELPEALQALVYRNAAFVDDRRFGADMHALNESLVQLANRLVAERSQAAAGGRAAAATAGAAAAASGGGGATLGEAAGGTATTAEAATRTQPLARSSSPQVGDRSGASPAPSVLARDGAADPQAATDARSDRSARSAQGLAGVAAAGGAGGSGVGHSGARSAESPGPQRGERRRRALGWLIAAALVAVVLVGGAILALGGGDDDDADGGRIETFDVVVAGTRPFTDTGIDVGVGDRVEIRASGTVRHARNLPETEVGPDGADDDDLASPELNDPGIGVHVNPPGHGGLVGRIGNDRVFGVGSSRSIDPVPAAGRLLLGINDFDSGNIVNAVANNSGAFQVEVSVTRR